MKENIQQFALYASATFLILFVLPGCKFSLKSSRNNIYLPSTEDTASQKQFPAAETQTFSIVQGTTVDITLRAKNQKGEIIVYQIVSLPSKGVLSGKAPNLTYTAWADSFGEDGFLFRVGNGDIFSDPASILFKIVVINPTPTQTPEVVVNPIIVNQTPLATAQSVTVNQRDSTNITLQGTDPESNVLNYQLVLQPLKGTLSGTPPNLIYTTIGDNFGADSFTFKINAGELDSPIATVSININLVNRPPTAQSQNLSSYQRTPIPITLLGNDPEGGPITFQLISQPSKGTLTGTAPDFVYSPIGDLMGQDSFSFVTQDGLLQSTPATIFLDIQFVNRAPTALAQNITVDQRTPKNITLQGTDPDGNSLAYTLINQPTKGSLSGSMPNFIYSPTGNNSGADSFSFKVNDGSVDSEPATVSILINIINRQPIAESQSLTLTSSVPHSILLGGSDPDGDSLSYQLLSEPSLGFLSGTAPNLTYTPHKGVSGQDSFQFSVNDGTIDSTPANISLTIAAPLAQKHVGMFYFLHHTFAWYKANQDPTQRVTTVSALLAAFRPFTDLLPFPETVRITMTTPMGDDGLADYYCFYEYQPYPVSANDRLQQYNCNRTSMRRTLQRHARLLREAGVDFIIIDNTNNPVDDQVPIPNWVDRYGGEVTILRPIEIFMEEWSKIPNAPKVTIAGGIPSYGNYYHRMLRNIYNHPAYQNMIFKHNGKKIFFFVEPAEEEHSTWHRNPSAQIKAELEGTPNNFTLVPMWHHFRDVPGHGIILDSANQQRWDFLSPCLYQRDLNGPLRGSTTSVIDSTKECNQFVTERSPLGSVITARPSYHVPGRTASEALGTTGRLNGLTLQRQFQQILKVQPDFIFLSSWNEHSGGPAGAEHFRGPLSGMGDTPSDPSPVYPPSPAYPLYGDSRYAHFVDTYATEFSPDIEPTLEYGDRMYALTKGLVQLYKAGKTTCDNPDVCTLNFDYTPVWALVQESTGKFAYTSSQADRNQRKAEGYREICARTDQQDTFCFNGGEPRFSNGPFIAFNANRAARTPNDVVGIYRCYNSVAQSFWFTASVAECTLNPAAWSASPTTPIFYAAKHRTSEMLRAIRRCYGPAYHSIAVDSFCPANTQDEGILGYVH